ncbi:LytR/AlgR family response regulator transcription factor [Longibaculum muris]|uniref:LytR/AlgR family response regulator transcription factor n=1 Tax=Longibaculum muris TaxID=1796628 RepID=UPI0022E49216|nr:LytTR family DNA-binding domain-containing protein [Longibaculum muris]
MYNFAILDNSEMDSKRIKDKIDEIYPDQFEYHCDIYLDADNFSYSKYYDAIFLDIEMPQKNGFDIANLINQIYSTKIIFMTRHDNLVTSTFDYKPFHFIQKNNFDESAEHVLNILRKSLSQQSLKVINENNTSEVIHTDIISYIIIDNGIVTIHTFNNEIYTTWSPLSSLIKQLDSSLFVMISQSTIVNMNFIETTDNEKIILKNETQFSIASRKKSSFKKSYQQFLLK